MGSQVRRVAELWLIALLSGLGLAMAAEPDRRLVNAAAQQDRQSVRALLKAGRRCQHASGGRCDGASVGGALG